MTGAYLRTQRDGKWEPVEVEHLTDEERGTLLAGRDKEEIMRWLNCVCKTLAEVEKEHFIKIE